MQKLLPPILLFFTCIVMVLGHFFLPIWSVVSVPWNYLGFAFIIIGLIISFAGARKFKIVETNILTFDKPDKLVTSGLFAWSRNPMYLGFVFCALGVAISLGALSSLIIAFLFCITLDRWYVQFEEAKMEDTFGKDYLAYKKRVRRWF